MIPTITAFEQSPDRGQGLARDMPVRWAFEEVGPPYNVRLVSFSAMKESAHRALQPFGQIPTYEEDDLVLFESGAIVFHIAERHAGLLPNNANARARAIGWMFAALSTVEPVIVQREVSLYLESDKAWHKERLPIVEDRIRRLRGSDILKDYPNLLAYVARGETRPAFKRAFDAQLAVFTGKSSNRLEREG